MSIKTSFNSWLGYDEESSYATGIVVEPTGMHLIPEWDIKSPAPGKGIIWAHDPTKPEMTNIKLTQPSEIELTTKNAWNFNKLYLLMGSGAYAGGSGTISHDSGAVRSFALHGDSNGSERTYRGCVMREFGINIPKEGGNIFLDAKAVAADFVAETKTKPTTIGDALNTSGMSFNFYNGGAAMNDVFVGGRLGFMQNLDTETPDYTNNRMYVPARQNLVVTLEATFRIHSENNFLEAYESGSTGVFNTIWTMKNDSTGAYIDLSGFQIEEYSEPVPTVEVGIVEQTVNFVQSEDFNIGSIQITGVDFS